MERIKSQSSRLTIQSILLSLIFFLPRLVQIEMMFEYGTEFREIPEKPDEQFNVNKVLILYTQLFKC